MIKNKEYYNWIRDCLLGKLSKKDFTCSDCRFHNCICNNWGKENE